MKYFCPVCDDVLLCHLQPKKMIWFCRRCRQEMPNLHYLVRNAKPSTSLQPIKSLKSPKTSPITQKNNKQIKIKNKKLNLLDSVIIEGKKRLEIVNFILNQINYIVRYGFSTPKQDLLLKQSQLDAPEEKKINVHELPIAYFLIDSEMIILYICQAILTHDVTVLNKNKGFNRLKATYAKLNISIEPIAYFLYIIKTSVLDFLHSSTFEYTDAESRQICSLDTEIANYFDVVITSII